MRVRGPHHRDVARLWLILCLGIGCGWSIGMVLQGKQAWMTSCIMRDAFRELPVLLYLFSTVHFHTCWLLIRKRASWSDQLLVVATTLAVGHIVWPY